MKLNYDRGKNILREILQEFRGINKRLRPSESEFRKAFNMSTSEYPALVSRRERKYNTNTIGRCGFPSLCSLGDGKIAYIGESEGKHYIYIDGEAVYEFENIPETPHKMVKMGQYLCVFPEGIVYNIADNSVKRIRSEFSNYDKGKITFSPCKIDGKIAVVSDVEPSEARIGDVWYSPAENKTYLCTAVTSSWSIEKAIIYANNMDLAFATDRPLYAVQVSSFTGGLADGSEGTLLTYNGGTYIVTDVKVPIGTRLSDSPSNGSFMVINDSVARKCTLWHYRTNRPKWVEYGTSYTRISASVADIADYFSEGDVIKVDEYGYSRIYTAVKATENEAGYIVTDSISTIGEYGYAEKPLTLSRDMPEGMTNIIEASNRLWATDALGREIYASKLGDPFNWYAFSGLASDSYAITVGIGGVFTGAISYDGYPHFFKETSIMKVYGNYPFRLYTLDCPGVASNASESVAVYNGAIVYKGVDGFYAYNGSYPTLISESIGDETLTNCAVTASASDNSAYYAAVKINDKTNIYVYQKGMWHLQDSTDVADMCFTGRGVVYAFGKGDGSETEQQTYYLASSEVGQLNYYTQETYTVGDIDGDGRVTEADVNIARKIVMGTYTPTNDEILRGDTDGNGEIDRSDYLLISRMITEGPVDWYFETAEQGLYLPFDKWYSHFIFRYYAEKPFTVTLKYSDGWEERYTMPEKAVIGSESIQIPARKTEYLTIKAEGSGRFALLSIAKNIEGGNTP